MDGTQRLRVTVMCAVTAIASSGCTLVGSPGLISPPASPDSFPEGTPSVEAPSRSGNMVEYEQSGRTYRVLESSFGYDERGTASWYGEQFQGRPTSSGEPFDLNRLSAAHRTLPLPSWVRVTNLSNGLSILLRVNDRGPFADPDRRIIDVSYAAAVRLGMVDTGTASVRVQAVEPWQSRTPGNAPD
ncbi:MAG: septal ring lytic transglycosylase RlpA family protein [Longimicrobiales bacterium]|nr:septal ring lytic transglycosylase RlpA family protein [Longimicrobiales bacterium]